MSPTTRPLLERLQQADHEAARRFGVTPASRDRLDDALRVALDPQRLIDVCAEAWRVSADQARDVLAANGFEDILARLKSDLPVESGDESAGPPLSAQNFLRLASGHITLRTFNPALHEPQRAPQKLLETIDLAIRSFCAGAAADPLARLYRVRPMDYAERWLRDDAPKMLAYLRERFGATGPRYLVNSGIGANEQFNYFVAALANARPGDSPRWLLVNSPKEIARLPVDASVDNTLFLEFSRSGITEETVKLHEFTPRQAARVVFANGGPLRALGERDGNLVLPLPDEVSGRYGRNKTPILLAPMLAAGMDVRDYWRSIDDACTALDLARHDSPAVLLARFLRTQQCRHGINHIYLGTNDDLLRHSADEFCQFWNEGVNRDGNDITMSRYLGLPRDSHMNLEAILGTSRRKLAVFLLRTGDPPGHPLLADQCDPIHAAHRGLTPGRTDLVLALANVKRCAEKMPVVLLTVPEPDLVASAWLGQLWADATLVYSRLIGVDPGSNPEVKNVRTRAAAWLADPAAALHLLDTPSAS